MVDHIVPHKFLNGVCRHEHATGASIYEATFLNGVCRHELPIVSIFLTHLFLNGVCRHEPTFK
ncbi:hypothetical protein URS_2227 [Acinetobacter ursingii]|nr:hypothetical protein URS_2227 [Acinetobacter ursingii]